MPSLLELAKNPVKDVSVVVVAHDETTEGIRRFFEGVPPGALNLRLDQDQSLATAFGVKALPVAFVVVSGQRVARFSGPQNWDSKPMRALLERFARETPRN